MEAGAVTYLLKDMLSAELLRVIRDVASGGLPMSDTQQALLAERAAHPTLTSRKSPSWNWSRKACATRRSRPC